MIAWLSGRLRHKAADQLIIDVAGVGYQVFIPLSTYSNIPDDGEDISLHIHTHVREDALSLFGFATQAEKDMFLLLTGVSGIGPKLALAILSSLSVEDLSVALRTSDDAKLYLIPGIGKKTAARMVLELKDKVQSIMPARSTPLSKAAGPDESDDVISALVNLGYRKTQAEEAVRKVRQVSSSRTVQELIKEALAVMMKQ